jgi:NO-binding membrane sensor protein with MHYT domain
MKGRQGMEDLEIVPQENWRPKVMVIGGVIGLMAGLLAAYLLIQRAEKQNQKPELNAGEGVKLGVLVFGLLRQIATLGEGK